MHSGRCSNVSQRPSLTIWLRKQPQLFPICFSYWYRILVIQPIFVDATSRHKPEKSLCPRSLHQKALLHTPGHRQTPGLQNSSLADGSQGTLLSKRKSV